MATFSPPRQQAERPPSEVSHSVPPIDARPAATAARRLFRVSLVLGILGLVSATFDIARLLESWAVTPTATSHRISIFGQSLTYPAANFGAIVITVLAGAGLIVTAVALHGVARELAASRRFHRRASSGVLRRLRGALVLEDDVPQAFCAGLLRPRVYVSTGALALLDAPALEAVLAHERHHAERYDPLRRAVGRVLARAVFFLPALKDLVRRHQELAELSADEAAVLSASENRAGLASAMLFFSDAGSSGEAAGVDPARVDYLLGRPPQWRLPVVVCLATLAVIGLLAAIAVLVGQEASGSATLAPPFLSRQPCIVILALVPASLGLAAAAHLRRCLARTRTRPL